MNTSSHEIPYNYTSADDRQAISSLLSPEIWEKVERLRAHRVTGRSAKMMMRFFGEILIHQRNPFLYEELVNSYSRRRRLFRALETDLQVIDDRSGELKHVSDILVECRRLLDSFRKKILHLHDFRRRISATLGAIVGKENVLFDPFTRISHATDATDWRLFLPVAVVMPTDESQVGPLLSAISKLNLHAIPRGAGTGLTGGCVPLDPDCVIINTERLNRIHGATRRDFRLSDGSLIPAWTLSLESGVVTEDAMEYAAARGLVFATDPTSAWASSIGGNISENAGGKASVLWGTAIDNLVSFKIAMPSGALWSVQRVDHPLRKILPQDLVRFEIRNQDGSIVKLIELPGSSIRKKGLWKDITNKALGGLPGVQKEGTDGVITSAEFILYPAYEHTSTLCLEFFGPDMDEASRVIQEIVAAFPNHKADQEPVRGKEVLLALEHFDDQYVRAIDYKVKTPVGETPKAVLLIDIGGHSSEETKHGMERIRALLAVHQNTYLHEAKDSGEAKRFWQDRKKLGAIAARTNAFKLNEDIVLPLHSLAEFARFVDEVNREEEMYNQECFARKAEEYLRKARPQEDPEWLSQKLPFIVDLCVRSIESIRRADGKMLRSVTLARQLRDSLSELVQGYSSIGAGIEELFEEVRVRLLVIATHMHAGDGNVHVNIPVLSNDRDMMRRAELLVDKVMSRVIELGGVVSGEHGIGVTKLKYLEPQRIRELQSYRMAVDPAGLMNPGKLADFQVLDFIFTPSFNLLELEARILQHGSLGSLASKIAQCVRCGKCKTNCCVFHPGRRMFFHPRNKNLAIGALIEALLYDAQRERSSSFEFLRYLEEVADHCTICHKCVKPCPVGIDTGQVSVLEREILMARKFKHYSPLTLMTLKYLDSQSKFYNRVFRNAVVRGGGAIQRLGARFIGPAQRLNSHISEHYWVRLLRSPMPSVDRITLRDVLPPCQQNQVLMFEPEKDVESTVFYFPGCGSERMFSTISMATIYVLQKLRTRVILPPPFLCCGFPAYANARTDQYDRTVLRDTIVFSQIREMFNYLSFDACIITCGTCREALENIGTGQVFGCEVVDLVRFAFARGLETDGNRDCLYHAPCHDSLDGQAVHLLQKIGRYRLQTVPHCCSEAGTLAMSRPDISDSMLNRKTVALKSAMKDRKKGTVLLTNCPSCLQGLGRQCGLGVVPRHIAVELAQALGGERWLDEFKSMAERAEAIHY